MSPIKTTEMLLSKEGEILGEYIIINGELYHYGVLGMKWGKRKAAYKTGRNARLEKKAYTYDKRAAQLTKKAEKHHATYDLGYANRAATKAAKYAKKAAIANKKALRADSEEKRLSLERKAAKLDYKSSKAQAKANRASKTTGYGAKAMSYSIKSDKVRIKAAKARAKIAKNKSYIAMMDRKMSTLSKDELRKVEQPFMDTMRESVQSLASNLSDKKK